MRGVIRRHVPEPDNEIEESITVPQYNNEQPTSFTLTEELSKPTNNSMLHPTGPSNTTPVVEDHSEERMINITNRFSRIRRQLVGYPDPECLQVKNNILLTNYGSYQRMAYTPEPNRSLKDHKQVKIDAHSTLTTSQTALPIPWTAMYIQLSQPERMGTRNPATHGTRLGKGNATSHKFGSSHTSKQHNQIAEEMSSLELYLTKQEQLELLRHSDDFWKKYFMNGICLTRQHVPLVLIRTAIQ